MECAACHAGTSEHEMNEGHSLDGAGGGRVQKVRVSEGGWIVDSGWIRSVPPCDSPYIVLLGQFN